MVFVQFVIPRFTNNAYESQLEALSAPTSKFELKENISYKYFFNCLYEDLKYDENLYQNSQNCSSKFIQHLNQIGQEIKKEVSLDSHVIEIGCGKGDFIQLLFKLGFNNLTGFDEAYQGNSGLFKKRYFSKEDQDLKADSIILRHTLEHIPNPFGFLNPDSEYAAVFPGRQSPSRFPRHHSGPIILEINRNLIFRYKKPTDL